MFITIRIAENIQHLLYLANFLVVIFAKIQILNHRRDQVKKGDSALPTDEECFAWRRGDSWGCEGVVWEEGGADGPQEGGETRGVEDVGLDLVGEDSVWGGE